MREYDEAALAALMEDYDQQFPTATELQRGSFEFESRMVLGRLMALSATVTFSTIQE